MPPSPKVTMHSRENMVILRARKERADAAHDVHYQNEVRPAVEFGNTDKSEIKQQEKALGDAID